MITAIAQALSDQTCIPPICFDPIPLLGEHGRWSQYDAMDPGSCELVIKAITEAACLITAFNRIIVIQTKFQLNSFNEANDLFIVRSDLTKK